MDLNFDALNDVLGGVDQYGEGEGEGEYAEGEYAEGEEGGEGEYGEGEGEGEGEYNAEGEGTGEGEGGYNTEATTENYFTAKVKYEFISDSENNITIYVGEEITVYQSEGEWWYGSVTREGTLSNGYFPASYVEISGGSSSSKDNNESFDLMNTSNQEKKKTGWRLERDNLKNHIQQQQESNAQLEKQLEEKKRQREEKEKSYLQTKYIHDPTAFYFDLIFMQLERNVEVKSFSLLAELDQKFSSQMKSLQELINKEMKDKSVESPKTELFKMFTLLSSKISDNLSSIGTLTNSSDQFLNVLVKFKNSYESVAKFQN